MDLQRISTTASFIAFLEYLIEDFRSPEIDWESVTIPDYLDGVVQAVKHNIEFSRLREDQMELSWQQLAEILSSARIWE